jgi:hypothetical protein
MTAAGPENSRNLAHIPSVGQGGNAFGPYVALLPKVGNVGPSTRSKRVWHIGWRGICTARLALLILRSIPPYCLFLGVVRGPCTPRLLRHSQVERRRRRDWFSSYHRADVMLCRFAILVYLPLLGARRGEGSSCCVRRRSNREAASQGGSAPLHCEEGTRRGGVDLVKNSWSPREKRKDKTRRKFEWPLLSCSEANWCALLHRPRMQSSKSGVAARS